MTTPLDVSATPAIDDEHPGWRDLARAAREVVGIGLKAAPAAAVGSLVLVPAAAALTVLAAYWIKLITNAAVNHDQRAALWAAIALAASLGFSRAMTAGGIRVRLGLQERTSLAMEQRLATAVSAVPTLELFETPTYLDRLDILREQREYFSHSLSALSQGLRELVGVVATILLLLSVHPLLAVLVALGVPGVLLSVKGQQMAEDAREQVAEGYRLAGHLIDLAGAPTTGREVRIFGLAPTLHARWADAAKRADDTVLRTRMRASVHTLLAWLPFGIGVVVAVAWTVFRTLEGASTPGDVALVAALAAGIAANLEGVAGWSTEVTGALRFLVRYVYVTSLADPARRPTTPTRKAPDAIRDGIRLDSVSFAYPGTDRLVLEDVTLTLKPGAVVALVGENGAGKTTIAKLLCGLYRPTSGTITVDDTDLHTIAPQAWSTRLAAGFQDFMKFELLARETIGVGNVNHVHDHNSVIEALERAAVTEVVAQLPDGLDTQLGKTWDGTDLSTGQWQKLALGRAMMRPEPLVLVLDEPTASLDAETEHRLFETYAATARQRRDRGAITVLVSHRFSTVRMADEIVVIAAGRVVEHGDHRTLMHSDGLYAELFELQSKAYR